MAKFLSNREIYERGICGILPQAEERLWIATADIKDMYGEPSLQVTEAGSGGRDMVPFGEVQDGMLKRGVEQQLIHAKEPGTNWRSGLRHYSSGDPVV